MLSSRSKFCINDTADAKHVTKYKLIQNKQESVNCPTTCSLPKLGPIHVGSSWAAEVAGVHAKLGPPSRCKSLKERTLAISNQMQYRLLLPKNINGSFWKFAADVEGRLRTKEKQQGLAAWLPGCLVRWRSHDDDDELWKKDSMETASTPTPSGTS